MLLYASSALCSICTLLYVALCSVCSTLYAALCYISSMLCLLNALRCFMFYLLHALIVPYSVCSMLCLLHDLFAPCSVCSMICLLHALFAQHSILLYVQFASTSISMLLHVLFQAELYAGSLFIKQILGWNIYLSTILFLLITSVYTIGGEYSTCTCIQVHAVIRYYQQIRSPNNLIE